MNSSWQRRRRLPLAAALLDVALACSTVHVHSSGATVIGRTMELGGPGNKVAFGGLQLGGDPDPGIPWEVVVHRRGEPFGEDMAAVCGVRAAPWAAKFGFLSVDATGPTSVGGKATITVDGLNQAGLTVSAHTLRQSVYMQPNQDLPNATHVCFADLTAWLLGNIDSVSKLRDLLPRLHILAAQVPVPSGQLLHWTVDDTNEEHVVIEVRERNQNLST